MEKLWVVVPGTLALVGLVHWLLVATEGTYLGPKVVTLLYDWSAARYDGIKNLRYVDEARCLGVPLAHRMRHIRRPWVLDVATGTGRVPLALLRTWGFGGTVVGVDRSLRMLSEARSALGDRDGRVVLMREDAEALSFGEDVFDCVACLEALEFMRDPGGAVREMARVLKPGGVLLMSNRVGRDAWFFPGRSCGRGRLERCLGELGLGEVTTERWQVHYDLIWARKAGERQAAASDEGPRGRGSVVAPVHKGHWKDREG